MPRIKINSTVYKVAENLSVAAAVMNVGLATRTSIQGQPRGPLCGMGICFECRVTINGAHHERSCLVKVVEGMEIKTNAL